MVYQHQFVAGQPADLPLGKVVCVGRNYAEHARELNNPLSEQPLLFIKPASAVVALSPLIKLPDNKGPVHYESEMALLIGSPLTRATPAQAQAAIVGVGLALDLTLRTLQSELKQLGQPWEKAKAFDGACPLSPFVPISAVADLNNLEIRLRINGELRQQGNSGEMLTPMIPLLSYISEYFTLQPGDVVLTGTPAGVGPLVKDDQLELTLGNLLRCHTTVG